MICADGWSEQAENDIFDIEVDIKNNESAVLMLSCDEIDIGTIVSASNGACRLFGYTKFDLEKRFDVLNTLYPRTWC